VRERTNGSHRIYSHPKISRPFPIQNVGGQAKPYQVRQLLKLMRDHNLRLNEEDGEASEEE
jgi:predicted RNA binding protein YcfA (HicA-like mRNA interferase family)